MKILGVETSCDETSIAVLEINPPSRKASEGQVKVLSNIVSSQVKIHAPYGGVVPSLAAREHQKNLVPVLIQALQKAKLLNSNFQLRRSGRSPDPLASGFPTSNQFSKSQLLKIKNIFEKEPELLKNFLKAIPKIKPPQIDLIAVTIGPGLEIALWNGLNFAKAIALLWKKPLIGINHLEAHIYSNFLPSQKVSGFKFQVSRLFPALNLIVSGGHTQLVLMEDHGKFKILGETLDDAAGEAFDKVARMMNLGFPGGPIISKLALKGTPEKFALPRPMLNQKNYNFSFSGLKTAVLYLLKEIYVLESDSTEKRKLKIKQNICASFQQATIDVLTAKTIRAAKEFRVKSVLLSGGVSANKLLRKTLQKETKKLKVPYSHPDFAYTGDNAVMIALAGYYKNSKIKMQKSKLLKAEPNLRIKNWA